MTVATVESEGYGGPETGLVRPPSEAGSLLVRVSRNCPWNRCRFCPLYKGRRFSRRPVEHVLRDIDLMAAAADRLSGVRRRTVFLQDANALAASYDDLLTILLHIKERLPWVERVTSYARSHTILRFSPAQLSELKAAGLRRIHVGFESGSDSVLAFMQKGATKDMHLEAGLRVKQAGMELSVYYMPGLGGRPLLDENAFETADLVRRVAPDYLRVRSLAISDRASLAQDVAAGVFVRANDVDMVRELLMFLEQVGDVPSRLVSDHLVNLLSGLTGDLSTQREALIATVRQFLSLEPEAQRLFMLGRRLGVLVRLSDMEVSGLRARVEDECARLGLTGQDPYAAADALAQRFI